MASVMDKLRTAFRASSHEGRAAILELARAMANGKVPDQERLESALIASGKTFADFEQMVETIRAVKQLESETKGIDEAGVACEKAARAVTDHRDETNHIIRERHRQSLELLAAQNAAQRVAKGLQSAAARLSTLRREHAELLGEKPIDLDRYTLATSDTSVSILDQDAPTLYVDMGTLQREQHRRTTLLQRAFARAKQVHESALAAWSDQFHTLQSSGDWREARKLKAPELETPTWRDVAGAA